MEREDERLVRLVIVDDETVSRTGLLTILREDPAIAVVASADTLERAVSVIQAQRPSVVVAGVELAKDASELGPRLIAVCDAASAAVLFILSEPNVELVRQIRRIGAAGVISKRGSEAAIRGAVHAVHAGSIVLPRPAARPSAKPPSGREREIIEGVADGQTNDEIAGKLGLSPRTIASHLRRCFARYGVSSRTELAMLAVREQWHVTRSATADPTAPNPIG